MIQEPLLHAEGKSAAPRRAWNGAVAQRLDIVVATLRQRFGTRPSRVHLRTGRRYIRAARSPIFLAEGDAVLPSEHAVPKWILRTKRRRPSSPSTRSRGWHPYGIVVRLSGRQHRHRRVTAQSSRAGRPRSFKDSFRARRRGLSSTAPSRSTTVKGSPLPSRYFSRRDAGQGRVKIVSSVV